MIRKTGTANLEFTGSIPVEQVEEWLGTLPAGTKLNVSAGQTTTALTPQAEANKIGAKATIHACWTN